MHFDAPASEPHPEGFEPWELEAARAVITSCLAVRGPIHGQTFDDLLQEGLIAWLEVRHRYSNERGANGRTFLNRVITNRLRDLSREVQAEKRTASRDAASLDALQEEMSLHDFIPDKGAADPVSSAEASELAGLIARVRRRLTGREQIVLDGLLADRTPTEVAGILGPRA